MAWTQADLDRLNAALVSGTMRVVVDGREVTYQKRADLLAARNEVSQSLARAAGTVPIRRLKIYSTKDL